MSSSNKAIATLVSDHLGGCLLPEGFRALRAREYGRQIGQIVQRVLLEGRGVSGARSTYLVYFAHPVCRPPLLTGFSAGARLDDHPWDLSTPEAARQSLPEIAGRVTHVVIPWMRATATLEGLAERLAGARGAHPQPRSFELAVIATMRGSLAEARRLLADVVKGPLPFWSGPDSPARQLLEAIETSTQATLLSAWEAATAPR